MEGFQAVQDTGVGLTALLQLDQRQQALKVVLDAVMHLPQQRFLLRQGGPEPFVALDTIGNDDRRTGHANRFRVMSLSPEEHTATRLESYIAAVRLWNSVLGSVGGSFQRLRHSLVNALDILRMHQLEEVLAGVRIGGVPAQY